MDKRMNIDRAELSDLLRNAGLWSALTDAAFDLAELVHVTQRRAGGGPYLEEHVYPVTATVAQYLADNRADRGPDTVIISLLHDTVEDSDSVGVEAIHDRFGPTIAQGVNALTKPEKRAGSDGEESADAEERYVAGVAAAPWNIRLVKVFDRLNNLAAVHERSAERRHNYLEETREYFLDLAASVDPELEVRMATLLAEQEARFEREVGNLSN